MVKRREPATAKKQPTPEEIEAFASGADGGSITPKQQACLRPRERFWDIPVPKIDSAFDNLFVPQPSWSPSTTQQLRKLVAAPYLPPNDWTPRSEAYFVFPLAQGTPGKQCGLAATGVYQPSLRSPWLSAEEKPALDPNAKREFKAIRVPFNEFEYSKLEEVANKTGRTKLNVIRWAILKLAEDVQEGHQ